MRTASLSAKNILGGTKVLRHELASPMDWVYMIRDGMPSDVLDSLTMHLRITQSELSRILGIPTSTLSRHKRAGKLNSRESNKLYYVARVVERAIQVFGELDAALAWLKSPNASLSGSTPMSWLDTGFGAEAVTNALDRLRPGDFA
jgi:putative toxin-antitoxin system antitoxin component (TIGR02293 family)